MKFDVMREPCVPVEYLDGSIELVSIYDSFKDAHKIRSISVESCFEAFGVRRFLVTMLMDWLRPENDAFLKNLYNHGHFDMNSFNEYVKICEESGDVFNIYSETRPFYQVPAPSGKLDLKKITNLFHTMINGENHVLHYEDVHIDNSDIFLGLITQSLFLSGKAGEGYSPTINGNSPYYFWIQGSNLFHELILNSISIETWELATGGAISYVDGTGESVLWRRKSPIPESKSKTKLSNISLLEGLSFLGRRNTIITDDNLIKGLSIKPSMGYNYKTGIWRDPHCVMIMKEDKETKAIYRGAYNPSSSDTSKIWQSRGLLYNAGSDIKPADSKPLTLFKFGDFTSSSDPMFIRKLNSFGLSTLKMSVYGGYNPGGNKRFNWYTIDTFNVYPEILQNEYFSKKYIDLLSMISLAASCIKSNLVKPLNLSNFYLLAFSKLDELVCVCIEKCNDDSDIILDEYLDSLESEFKGILLVMAKNYYKDSLQGYDFNKSVKNPKKGSSGYCNTYRIYNMDLNTLIFDIKSKLKICD